MTEINSIDQENVFGGDCNQFWDGVTWGLAVGGVIAFATGAGAPAGALLELGALASQGIKGFVCS